MTTGGLVSILFTDLGGSPEMLERLGDDAAEEVRRTHFALLRRAVEGQGGEEVKSTGDGLMVAFRSCAGALACACAMQEATERQNEALADISLGLRVGVNAGDVISAEDDYFGAAVVVAKRLCDRAEGGQVLCSELVRRLVGTRGGHRFRELGSLSLKGLADPIRAYELAWETQPEAGLASMTQLTGGPPAKAERAEAAPPPLPAALSATDGAFVGREAQLEQLWRALERARTGARELILIAGEPGVGKTRLAAELAARAHAAGARVLYGHAYQENLVPHQPFVESLTPYLDRAPPGEVWGLVDGDLAADLATLLPELRRRLAGLPEPPKIDPETARYRMFEAADLLLSGLAAQAPLVLVLDDLHWADRPTLLLLRHVALSHRRSPLLVVGAYRESELSREHPLSQALAELRRGRPPERISLQGLSEKELSSLIAGWAGAEPPLDFVRALRRDTGGNPLYCREVLRHLLARGAIGEGVGFPTDVSLERIGVPERVQEVIEGRLVRLSEPADLVLSIAAVRGREFGLRVVQRVSGLTVEELLEALEEATLAGLITEVPRTARYAFTHALVRETLYTGLSDARRRHLHRRVGEALEGLHADDPEPHLAEIAQHFFEAAPLGEADRAIEYARRAGERAIKRLAYEEATSHYERALDALELAEQPDDGHRRCGLLLGLGDARTRAGDGPGARRVFEQAAEIARRLGTPEQLARAALGVGEAELGAAWFAVGGVINEPLVRLLEEARAALGDADSALRARVCAHLARQLYYSDEHQRREQLAEESIEVARRLEDPGELAAALAAKAFSTFGPQIDSIAAIERLLSEALRLAEEAGNPELVLQLQIPRLRSLRERGDRKALDRAIDTYVALAEELRHAYGLWFARVLRATQAIFDGRFAEAERLAGEALGPELPQRHPNALQMFGGQIATIRFAQGRLPELEAGVTEYVAKFPRLAAWSATLASIHAEAGREAAARRELERLAADEFAAVRPDAFWFYCMGQLSWVCAALDDREHAVKLYRLLVPYQGRYIVIPPLLGSLGPVSLHLTLLAVVMRRFEEAAEHAEDALSASENMRDRPFVLLSDAIRTLIPLLEPAFQAEEPALRAYQDVAEACRELGVKPLHKRPLFRRTFLTVAEELEVGPVVEEAFCKGAGDMNTS